MELPTANIKGGDFVKEGSIERSFDFSIRLTELVKYLQGEDREFPLSQRLLICGVGIGVCLRAAETSDAKGRAAKTEQALLYAIESGYLLELMVKTGYLGEQQSRPILEDCRQLKEFIANAKKRQKQVDTGASSI